MIDMTLISSILNTLNTSYNIAKNLKDIDVSMNAVALKTQIIELMESLIASKSQLAELKSLILDKDEKIKKLEEELQAIHSNVMPVVKDGMYQFEQDNGYYCTGCWDSAKKKIRLAHQMHGIFKCTVCSTHFNARAGF